MPRTLAIGDIHGCRNALEILSEYVGFEKDDCIVTLGDYVDRGPDSKGVIDFLIDLKQRFQVHCLRGNHEIMMMDPAHLKMWKAVGGNITLASYDVESTDEIPPSHQQFLDSLIAYFETDEHLFVHANAYPDIALDQQPDYMLYWEHLVAPVSHISGKVLICGHTAQRSGVPLNFGNTICVDTYAYGDGWLTCLDVGTGKYWQANERGDRRCDIL